MNSYFGIFLPGRTLTLIGLVLSITWLGVCVQRLHAFGDQDQVSASLDHNVPGPSKPPARDHQEYSKTRATPATASSSRSNDPTSKVFRRWKPFKPDCPNPVTFNPPRFLLNQKQQTGELTVACPAQPHHLYNVTNVTMVKMELQIVSARLGFNVPVARIDGDLFAKPRVIAQEQLQTMGGQVFGSYRSGGLYYSKDNAGCELDGMIFICKISLYRPDYVYFYSCESTATLAVINEDIEKKNISVPNKVLMMLNSQHLEGDPMQLACSKEGLPMVSSQWFWHEWMQHPFTGQYDWGPVQADNIRGISRCNFYQSLSVFNGRFDRKRLLCRTKMRCSLATMDHASFSMAKDIFMEKVFPKIDCFLLLKSLSTSGQVKQEASLIVFAVGLALGALIMP